MDAAVSRQYDNSRRGEFRANRNHRVYAVQFWHLQIHEDYIRTMYANWETARTGRVRAGACDRFLTAELDEILRRTMQLEIERQALKKEKDAASRERLSKIEAEVANLRAEGDALKARWQLEKESVQALRTLREQIDRVKTEIDQAERVYDLNRAAGDHLLHPGRDAGIMLRQKYEYRYRKIVPAD